MKLDTAILGGMLTSMWTWSDMRCPSIISTPPLPLAELPEDLPKVLTVLVVDCFLSILWAKHDVVLAHPFGVRKAVRFLCHGVLLSLAAGDLNNHHPRGKGVLLHSISVIHPHSGWFFALCASHAGQAHEPQKAKRLPADLQTAVDTQFQRLQQSKARRPYEHDRTATARKSEKKRVKREGLRCRSLLPRDRNKNRDKGL